jgi:hypothetical protein
MSYTQWSLVVKKRVIVSVFFFSFRKSSVITLQVFFRRAPLQKLRTHRSLEAYCATLCDEDDEAPVE